MGRTHKSSKHVALRFVIYIRFLGAEPLRRNWMAPNRYAIALQNQYLALIRELDTEKVREARLMGRTAIRKSGLRQAAALFPEGRPELQRKSQRQWAKTQRRLKRFFKAHKDVLRCPICRMKCGLPKKSWPTRELAEQARDRGMQSGEKQLQVYECPVRPGYWHVGH